MAVIKKVKHLKKAVFLLGRVALRATMLMQKTVAVIHRNLSSEWASGMSASITVIQSLHVRRKGFGTVLEVATRLVDRLREHGAEKAIDIDGALQCESFDVIGRVGFGHDFRATADLAGPGAADCRTIKEGACCHIVTAHSPVTTCFLLWPTLDR